jgi:hypothetical protein
MNAARSAANTNYPNSIIPSFCPFVAQKHNDVRNGTFTELYYLVGAIILLFDNSTTEESVAKTEKRDKRSSCFSA